MSFCVLLFRAFVAAIPRELDEAAIIDGAPGFTLFFRVIFPLLRPVTITVILTQSVSIFNDFVNPLYFLPGDENATVQLTLYNFQSQFSTQYNLLFMDIVLVTIPPLILFIFFNRKIVVGHDRRRRQGLSRRLESSSARATERRHVRRSRREENRDDSRHGARAGVSPGSRADRVRSGLAEFTIEVPSWAFGNSGTRFKVFSQPGRAAGPVREDRRRGPGAPVHRGRRRGCRCTSRGTGSTTSASSPSTPPISASGIGAINSNLFQDDDYMLGSLTHPDPRCGRKAVAHHVECVEIMRATGSTDLKLWLPDGLNYPGQDDLRDRQERLAGLPAAGLRGAGPRPAAAAGVQVLRAVLLRHRHPRLGHRRCCTAWRSGEQATVVLDTGHHAPGTNIEFIVAMLLRQGRLGAFDFNSRFYADDDLMVGAADPFQLFRILHEIVSRRRLAPAGVRGELHARPVPQHRAEDPGPDPLGAERAGGHGQGVAGRRRGAARPRSRPATCSAPTGC